MKSWRTFLLGAVFGAVFGYLGVRVTHLNESTYGGLTEHYEYNGLMVLSFPGELLAEMTAGYDWRFDEAWSFRGSVILCNGIFWSMIPATLHVGCVAVKPIFFARKPDSP